MELALPKLDSSGEGGVNSLTAPDISRLSLGSAQE